MFRAKRRLGISPHAKPSEDLRNPFSTLWSHFSLTLIGGGVPFGGAATFDIYPTYRLAHNM